jgi:hypothetical protein
MFFQDTPYKGDIQGVLEKNTFIIEAVPKLKFWTTSIAGPGIGTPPSNMI